MRPSPLGNKRGRNATVVCALGALLGASSAGCSFMFSQGPPDDHARRLAFDCGESYAPPVLDTVGAGLFGLSALSIAGSSSANAPPNKGDSVAIAAGFAVLAAASAVYGYQAVPACREAKVQRQLDWARARAWLTQPPTAPSR